MSPGIADHVPGRQGWHWDTSVNPSSPLHVPSGHGSHEAPLLPFTTPYVPAGQGWHMLGCQAAARVAYLPRSQDVHEARPRPHAPAGQARHTTLTASPDELL